MSKKLTQVVLTFLVLITLAAGAAQAAPWSDDRPESAPFAALWDWIVSWFEASTPPDEGCGMDPNGHCGEGSGEGSTTSGDEGCGMDPNGAPDQNC